MDHVDNTTSKQPEMSREEFERLADDVISRTEAKAEEYSNFIERTSYMKLLYVALTQIKNVKRSVDQYYEAYPTETKLALDLRSGEIGALIFNLCRGLFVILEKSKEHYGYEDRQIPEGVGLHEIEGIDISVLGIPMIVPKSLESPQAGVVVSLQEIDNVRIEEFRRINNEVLRDPDKEKIVEKIIQSDGQGINLEPIFV